MLTTIILKRALMGSGCGRKAGPGGGGGDVSGEGERGDKLA